VENIAPIFRVEEYTKQETSIKQAVSRALLHADTLLIIHKN
jgi:hypothetical protein